MTSIRLDKGRKPVLDKKRRHLQIGEEVVVKVLGIGHVCGSAHACRTRDFEDKL